MPVTSSPLPATGVEIDQQTGAITVPMLLDNPTRVNRQIQAVATANYWADRVLPNGGGVRGGVVAFDIAQPGDHYSAREPEQIAPGAEFPIVNAAEPIPDTARVAKWGGKIKITDEKRQRNDVRYVQREQVRLANTMVRLLHRNAVAAIEAAVTRYARTGSWDRRLADIIITGTTPTNLGDRPAAKILESQAVADSADHNVRFDVLLVNTLDYAELAARVYPYEVGGVNRGMFPDGRGGANGEVIGTNLIPQGTSYLIASNEAGETRWESPLYTRSWYEDAIETSWMQSGARAVYFVDNPYAVLKLTEPA